LFDEGCDVSPLWQFSTSCTMSLSWGSDVAKMVVGNLLTLFVVGMGYLIMEMLASYFVVIFYAFLFSEAMWRPKLWVVQKLRGWLGHGQVAVLMVLGMLTFGAFILALFSVLSFLDLKLAVGDARDTVGRLVSESAPLERAHIDRALNMTLDTLNRYTEDFTAAHNTTAWWPVVDELIKWTKTVAVEAQHKDGDVMGRFSSKSYEMIDQLKRLKDVSWWLSHGRSLGIAVFSLENFSEHATQAVLALANRGAFVIAVVGSVTSSVVASVFFCFLDHHFAVLGEKHSPHCGGGTLWCKHRGPAAWNLGGRFLLPCSSGMRAAVLHDGSRLAARHTLSIPFCVFHVLGNVDPIDISVPSGSHDAVDRGSDPAE